MLKTERYILFIFISVLGLTFHSCGFDDRSIDTTSSPKIDSTLIFAKAEALQRELFKDTIDLERVQSLIDKGTDLDLPVPYDYKYYQSRWKENSLMDAIFGRNRSERRNFTALQATLFIERANCFEAMMLLLKAGADPNIITRDSIRCLDRVVQRSMKTQYIDSLLEYGADPALFNLSFAYIDIRTIDRFIKLGADPKTIDINHFIYENHFAKFQKGSWRGNFDHIMKYDIDAQKTTPHEINGAYEDYNKYALKRLLDKGLDLNQRVKTYKGEYWLQWAITSSGNNALIKYLIDRGARKCEEGVNPYDLAVKEGLKQSTIDYIEKHVGK